MNEDTQTFCGMIRNRSEENRQAMRCFPGPYRVLSPAFSILRQELDSMIRVIYLLSIRSVTERRRLIKSTIQGEKWKVKTSKGKWSDVTDREMVNLAQQLQGWTQSVYKFGCAFVHLSDFHNHLTENPFDKLKDLKGEIFSLICATITVGRATITLTWQNWRYLLYLYLKRYPVTLNPILSNLNKIGHLNSKVPRPFGC